MAGPETQAPDPRRGTARDRSRRGTKVVLVLIPATVAIAAAVLFVVIRREPTSEPAYNPPTALSSESRGSAPLPTPDCIGCKSGRTYAEQVGNGSPNTYRDPRSFVGEGKNLRPLQRVDVLCKLYAPSAPSVGDYWYLVVNPPWNGRYYSPSNSFLNGDYPNGNGSTAVDLHVPDC